MSWWGKIIGGAFGFMLGGPLGAALGAALGHNFDRGLDRLQLAGPADLERIRTAFFTATFSVMGQIAKADGRVSEDEIAFARSVMAHMSLNEEQRRVAISLFNEGKRPEFPLDEALEQFRRECRGRITLIRMFLEIQLQAAYADGHLDASERGLLLHIFGQVGFSELDFQNLEALVRGASRFAGEGARRTVPPRDRLREAYRVLGVSAQADGDEVKRAYRRLMNQHHPDKLVAKGLPEEMVKLANEKTHEIKSAYETIKAARGMR
jgi:DnaJ like chaperone protein